MVSTKQYCAVLMLVVSTGVCANQNHGIKYVKQQTRIEDFAQLMQTTAQFPVLSYEELIKLENELKEQDCVLTVQEKSAVIREVAKGLAFYNMFASRDEKGKVKEIDYNKLNVFFDNLAAQRDHLIMGERWTDVANNALKKAVGNRLEGAIDKTIGGVFDTWIYGTYRTTCYYANACYRTLRGALFGYTGVPFDADEVRSWRDSIKNMLTSLNALAKDADRMASRSADKILRQDKEDVISEEWNGLLQSDVMELTFIAACINESKKYYNVNSDRAIVHYAEQLQSLLTTLRTTILEKTKSFRDLGTTDYQAALKRLQSSIDKYFEHLIKHLNHAAEAEKPKPHANAAVKQNLTSGNRDALFDLFNK